MADVGSAVFHYLPEQVKGNTVGMRFTVRTPTHDPKDLTGATIRWVLKTYDKATQVLDESSAGVTVGIESPPTAGLLTISMASIATTALTDSLYYDELEVTDGNASVYTTAYGYIPFRDSEV